MTSHDTTGGPAVRVVDNADEHRFEAEVGGDLAIASYRLEGDTIYFTHTEVPDALEGKGVGSALARGALDQVRGRGLRVVPLCSFMKTYIERHAEYQNLVSK